MKLFKNHLRKRKVGKNGCGCLNKRVFTCLTTWKEVGSWNREKERARSEYKCQRNWQRTEGKEFFFFFRLTTAHQLVCGFCPTDMSTCSSLLSHLKSQTLGFTFSNSKLKTLGNTPLLPRWRLPTHGSESQSTKHTFLNLSITLYVYIIAFAFTPYHSKAFNLRDYIPKRMKGHSLILAFNVACIIVLILLLSYSMHAEGLRLLKDQSPYSSEKSSLISQAYSGPSGRGSGH